MLWPRSTGGRPSWCGAKSMSKVSAKAAGRPASTPLASLIANRPKQVEVLAALGLDTVARPRGRSIRRPSRCVSRARRTRRPRSSWPGPGSALRRPTAGAALTASLSPRADIEVDVDMENTNDGCYLWGALITDRRGRAPTPRYVAFVTWDPDIEAGELLAFKEFWSWFTRPAGAGAGRGRVVQGLLLQQERREGADDPDRRPPRPARRGGRVLASEDWVDLSKSFGRSSSPVAAWG